MQFLAKKIPEEFQRHNQLQLPLKKVTPLFLSNPPLKVEVLSSPPFLKIWLEAQPPPPPERGRCPLWQHPDNNNYINIINIFRVFYKITIKSQSQVPYKVVPY